MIDQRGTEEKRKKILVTDNSHTIRLVIKKYLKDYYDVIEAENGKETFQLIKEHKDIFMIIVSMELSDYDGYEIASELRKEYNKESLPIILNTSHNKLEEIVKALEVGFNDYIVKPFHKELLLSKIHKLEREIPLHDIELSKTIAKIPFFKGVPDSQVAYAINCCSETKIFQDHENICIQNENEHDIFILMEGKCDVLYNQKKVSEIKPVDIIGEMGFLENKARSATVIATEPSKLIVFQKEPFYNFLNEDRAISEIICKNVIHTLSERLNKSNKLIGQLNRVAHEHLSY